MNGNKERFELLIMSEAGKPIYSYSKREDAVTLMPLCSTLISYAQRAQQETLLSMRTSDNLVIHFTTRSPLIIIVIHEVHSYVDPQILVEQVEAQIISILTARTLRGVFQERPTFDLKRLLYGSEKLIDSTANLSAFPAKLDYPWVQSFLAVTSAPSVNNQTVTATATTTATNSSNIPSNYGHLSSAPRPHRVLVPIVMMPTSSRDTLHHILSSAIGSSSKNIVFSLLFRLIIAKEDEKKPDDGGNTLEDEEEERAETDDNSATDSFKLMTVCNHHNKHKMKISDIHIILALLDGSKSQLPSVESLWMPVCLPRFNQDAFLHSYIAYTNNMEHCLVILSVDRDEFFACQKARNEIEEKLNSLLNDAHQKSKLYYQMSPLVHPILLDLQRKLISNQLTSEEMAEAKQQAQIYNTKLEIYHTRQLQFLWYQTSKQVLWWQRSDERPLSQILYYLTKKMLESPLKALWIKLADNSVLLGWHVPTFQLYAQFDSTITTNDATEVIQRITNWIKKEEDNFSIKDYK